MIVRIIKMNDYKLGKVGRGWLTDDLSKLILLLAIQELTTECEVKIDSESICYLLA